MHLATMGGVIVIEEFLKAAGDYEVLLDECERAYGEHLSGFLHVPVQLRRTA
jgi:3-hydroxymyristoyl/3-hydroxydecanoyl-(acyl carrier protein) dehydratase